jgi:hypothetical protein
LANRSELYCFFHRLRQVPIGLSQAVVSVLFLAASIGCRDQGKGPQRVVAELSSPRAESGTQALVLAEDRLTIRVLVGRAASEPDPNLVQIEAEIVAQQGCARVSSMSALLAGPTSWPWAAEITAFGPREQSDELPLSGFRVLTMERLRAPCDAQDHSASLVAECVGVAPVDRTASWRELQEYALSLSSHHWIGGAIAFECEAELTGEASEASAVLFQRVVGSLPRVAARLQLPEAVKSERWSTSQLRDLAIMPCWSGFELVESLDALWAGVADGRPGAGTRLCQQLRTVGLIHLATELDKRLQR